MQDYDEPEIFEGAFIKSRKAHTCFECRNKIEKGEFYFRVKGLCDGDWFKYAICDDCETIGNWLVYSQREQWVFGELNEILKEIYDLDLLGFRFVVKTSGDQEVWPELTKYSQSSVNIK
jgi:hypothetical protein